jgi:hypothetical protein
MQASGTHSCSPFIEPGCISRWERRSPKTIEQPEPFRSELHHVHVLVLGKSLRSVPPSPPCLTVGWARSRRGSLAGEGAATRTLSPGSRREPGCASPSHPE